MFSNFSPPLHCIVLGDKEVKDKSKDSFWQKEVTKKQEKEIPEGTEIMDKEVNINKIKIKYPLL